MSEHQTEGGMTFDQAAAEISGAVASDPEFTPGIPADLPQADAPAADQSADAPTPGEETPDPGATEFASTEAAEDSFMEGDFNPDLLPDELKPGFKQLQAAFTRKTQELAEQRKQFEGIDLDEMRQAHDFYNSLRDPEYLKNFYQELGAVVRELDPEAVPAAEVEQAQETAPAEVPADLQSLIDRDPDLQPLAQQFSAMQQRLDAFEQQQAEREAALAEERQLMDDAAQIDRMVQAAREQYPNWVDEDWQAVYDRAIALDGDVTRAAELYAADQDRIIQSWLAKKQATPASVAPAAGAGTISESETQESMSLDDADKAAQAYLRANDMEEFLG